MAGTRRLHFPTNPTNKSPTRIPTKSPIPIFPVGCAAISIHVETLGEVVELIVRGRTATIVVAEKLPARDAAQLDMLMEILAVDDEDWVLGNSDGVKAMARTCTVLLLLQGTLLPALRWSPTNQALLGVVSSCAQKLRDVAVDAGGSARKEAGLLAESIAAFVENALQVPAVHAVLRDQIDSLKERCLDLLATQCTLTQN